MFSQKLKKIFLVLGDIFILYLSLYLTLLVRYGTKTTALWERHFLLFSIIFAIWLVVFYIAGLYELTTPQSGLSFSSLLGKITIINTIIAIAFFYFFPNPGLSPKRVLFIDILFTTTLIFLWRGFYGSFLKSKITSNKLLFIGINEQVKELITKIVQNPQLGYETSIVITPLEQKIYSLPEQIKIIKNNDFNLPQIIKQEKIQTVVNALPKENNARLIKQLYQSLFFFFKIYHLPSHY